MSLHGEGDVEADACLFLVAFTDLLEVVLEAFQVLSRDGEVDIGRFPVVTVERPLDEVFLEGGADMLLVQVEVD